MVFFNVPCIRRCRAIVRCGLCTAAVKLHETNGSRAKQGWRLGVKKQ